MFKAHPELLKAGYEVEFGLLLGDCHVDDARNRLVNDFLKSSCDDLVFIDADVGFQSEDLIRLLSHDRDVVGGTYPQKNDVEVHPVGLLPGEIWSDKDGLIEVASLPAGFFRIRRNALETLAAQSNEYSIVGEEDKIRQVFERLILNGIRISSDVAFCRKWRDRGGKIYADPNCYLEHCGNKIWTGTLGAYLRRINGISLHGIKLVQSGKETDRTYVELELEWGNAPWSAGVELLKTSVQVARQVKGAVLETGSGLTTLLMAAANPELVIHALEHSDAWADKVEEAIKRLGLTNIVIHRVPLKEYPSGRWYDVPRLPWNDFELVLCDGPPRQEGNRKILFGVMATHDCRPKCVLVDDADTEGDSIPAPYKTEIKGQLKKFAVGLR